MVSLTRPSVDQENRDRIFLLREEAHEMNGQILNLGRPLGEAVKVVLGFFPMTIN